MLACYMLHSQAMQASILVVLVEPIAKYIVPLGNLEDRVACLEVLNMDDQLK